MTMQPVSEIRQADQIPPADLWLGRLAHDLRGPIGPLQLAARMLEGSAPLPTQLNELGRTIERQTSLLLQVADELDDLLSISLGVFRLHLVRCDLAAIVENAAAHASQCTRSIGKQGHPVAVRAAAASIPVDADEKRLAQLIGQLLMALPSGEPGHATCWVQCECVGEHAFVRLHHSEARIYRSDAVDYLISGIAPIDPGTLGMAPVIGRQIANAHAATISSNEMQPGPFSELSLRMPLASIRHRG
jgi:hypothetical protein